MRKYLAITPARDEQALLPNLIACMVSQTVRPERWIVIDDGSGDATGEIIDQAAAQHPWIETHHVPRGKPRAPGGESVLMNYLPAELWGRFDFILRLDADLTFGPEYVDHLMREFARDPKLGITGGTLFEPAGNHWREVRQPAFHVRGATKMYSRACFEAIGGLEAALGWDTIDEARAMMLGFRSRSFRHIRAFHHRPAGSAAGRWRGHLAAGRAAFYAGYSPVYMMARALKRATEPPWITSGVLLLVGYFEGYLRRRQMVDDPKLVKFVRRQQLRRLAKMDSVWR